MTVTVYEVLCAECGEETTVGVKRWAATFDSPAEAEVGPEECPKCGAPWPEGDAAWREIEPDDVEPPDPYDYDDQWEPRW